MSLDNFQFLRKFWSCVSSVYWRKMRRKPQEQTLQYLSHGLTNPKFETTFANRHSGVPGVEVVSEFRVGQVPWKKGAWNEPKMVPAVLKRKIMHKVQILAQSEQLWQSSECNTIFSLNFSPTTSLQKDFLCFELEQFWHHFYSWDPPYAYGSWQK